MLKLNTFLSNRMLHFHLKDIKSKSINDLSILLLIYKIEVGLKLDIKKKLIIYQWF